MLKKGAHIVLECLREQGVDRVFGYPGNAILSIYDALYDYKDSVRHVLMTHEQHAAHAADGYARATGKTGVVLSTSGPGATNLLTGLSSSYMDSTPVVAITSNVTKNCIGKDSFQEVDIFGISMPVTKHNFMVKDVHSLADTIRSAFAIASSGRPGPVLVDILSDVADNECEYTPVVPLKPIRPLSADDIDFAAAASLINESSRPMIFAGGGIIASGAGQELRELAEKICAPVALSLMGIGCFSRNSEKYAGMLGMYGTGTAAACTQDCDLLIAIGTRFSDRSVPLPESFATDAKILHIDIDPAEINKNVPSSISLIGDAGRVLTELLPLIADKQENPLLRHLQKKAVPFWESTGGMRPSRLLETLGRVAGPNQIYTTEVGQNQIWAARNLPVSGPRKFITSGGLGSMGFGLGAAIGACIGTGKPVINIAGDASFYMNLAELSTAVTYRLPIVEVILNNRSLGLVRQIQKTACNGRYSEVDFDRPTDFCALAKAFGAKEWKIEKEADAEAVFLEALALGGPCVIECTIDPDEPV